MAAALHGALSISRCGYDITPSERKTTKLLNGTIVSALLRCYTKTNDIAPTIIAAADAPDDHFPIELRPQYYTQT